MVNEKSARFVEHELSDPRTRNITGNIIDAYDYTRYYFTSALARSGISDKERQSYGSSLEEMVIKCRFNNVACNKTYWKWRYDSYYGNCFMFNWDKNSVLNSKLSQKANGLSVVLYLPFYDNFYAFNSDFGAFVSINHVSASQMSSLNTGYDISVNTATNIALDRVVTNMLPPPYFDCIESEDIASYGSAYSHLFTEYNLTYKQSYDFKETREDVIFIVFNYLQGMLHFLLSEEIAKRVWLLCSSFNSDLFYSFIYFSLIL